MMQREGQIGWIEGKKRQDQKPTEEETRKT